MSVERNHQYVGLSCDECPEASEEFTDFELMIAELKALGWKITRNQDGYKHLCPACGEPEDPVKKARRMLLG